MASGEWLVEAVWESPLSDELTEVVRDAEARGKVKLVLLAQGFSLETLVLADSAQDAIEEASDVLMLALRMDPLWQEVTTFILTAPHPSHRQRFPSGPANT